MAQSITTSVASCTPRRYNPLINPTHSRPALVEDPNLPGLLTFKVVGAFPGLIGVIPSGGYWACGLARYLHLSAFLLDHKPLLGALLFENTTSDARDHCANERTFLSWLRLSMYLAIVSLAIIISFHFREQPSGLERRMALPLGIIFWLLSLTCLVNGFFNYARTVMKYSRKAALVQSGWKTQVVMTVIGTVILGSCILFLSTGRQS